MGKTKNAKYTREFKESSAKLAASSEQAIRQTALDLGINITTLYGWVEKYCPKSKPTKALSDVERMAEELKQLRKENRRLTQERDILKKATAYFARETE